MRVVIQDSHEQVVVVIHVNLAGPGKVAIFFHIANAQRILFHPVIQLAERVDFELQSTLGHARQSQNGILTVPSGQV